ncbi:hypothetical protein E2C01_072824 [Portunus trituberculatus]|uniref:Uncharacterized protein n=1 Tax=Portunus trituberculatus TaxID=210409 RepID=A0A5B7I138_PORTR|nr:hypothetical protein [Portunus trituberculatus]
MPSVCWTLTLTLTLTTSLAAIAQVLQERIPEKCVFFPALHTFIYRGAALLPKIATERRRKERCLQKEGAARRGAETCASPACPAVGRGEGERKGGDDFASPGKPHRNTAATHHHLYHRYYHHFQHHTTDPP